LQRDVSRHGKVVWYVRFGKGPKTRIKGVYGSPEFDAAYQAAVSGERVQPLGSAAKGTIEWLWMLYRQSPAWTGLSLATRRQREHIMKHVLKAGGKEPLSRINKNAIIKGRDKRAATPWQAKHFVTTMRACSSGRSTSRIGWRGLTQRSAFHPTVEERQEGRFPGLVRCRDNQVRGPMATGNARASAVRYLPVHRPVAVTRPWSSSSTSAMA
jgi:hypothetical protein